MPRISAASVEEHREQVHQRVFEAFATLMAERSYDAISMAHLAAAAELGRTAIYHHFADKEAVVVAFASHETSRYLDGLQADLDGVEGSAARLGVFVRHSLAAGQQFHMGLGTQLYGVLSRESLLAIRDHVVAVEDVLRGLLTDGVADGSFTLTPGDDVGATMQLIHACLGPRHLDPDVVEAFVLRALGGPGPGSTPPRTAAQARAAARKNV